MSTPRGVAGRLAAAFIDSRLTPLFVCAAIGLGMVAVLALPREEEPQIIVPMIDVFVQMPGASPAEVEQRVTRPLEKLLWEMPGVEYLYSTSSPGLALVIVRFYVGQPEEAAIVRLNQKIAAHMDLLPPGVSPPLVKPRSIDDVPIMAVTLWGPEHDDHELRLVAGQVHDAIKEVPDVSEVTIHGGRPRQVTVDLDPARVASYDVDPLAVHRAIVASNTLLPASAIVSASALETVEAGTRLAGVDAVRNVVVRASGGQALRVSDVASVRDGDGEPDSYVTFHSREEGAHPAVTMAVAKRKGTNAVDVTNRVEQKLQSLRGQIVPASVRMTVTRNYGDTAREKSNELLWHMLLAVLSVSALIWFALGRREAVVVLVAIPVTLALTLFVFYLYGYTLNRITLFALIFSIGILVDDAIVVVENVARHVRMRTRDKAGFEQNANERERESLASGAGPGAPASEPVGESERRSPSGEQDAIVVVENVARHVRMHRGAPISLAAIALRAVDEVGNPTVLATFTVVAAVLPNAFVGGLSGPYMRPIPVGASAAMMFSLLVAFIVTPWAASRLLSPAYAPAHQSEDVLTGMYRRAMRPLIAKVHVRWAFLTGVGLLLLSATALVPLGLVSVKMLPFDNKNEFQVMVDMPEGTPLEETARVVAALADQALEEPTVTDVQTYAGTAAPYNFNGLVRHYFLRRGPHLADLQVNLVRKGERPDQSHEIAKRVRTALVPVAHRFGATIQVAEVPPGPPVLQTLVAEVYGPDEQRRLALAREVRRIFEQAPGVVDVDWYVEDPQPKWRLEVDAEKSAAAGLTAAAVASVVRMAGNGEVAGLLHDEQAREDVPIVLRLPRSHRASLEALQAVRLVGTTPVAVGEITRPERSIEAQSIYHKNLLPVTYVTGDVAGVVESPVYAILQMNKALERLVLPEGYRFEVFTAAPPADSSRYAMKWDGEWHITYEVFRDLGLAFAAVLVLIYILVVGWFRSFLTPVTIMAAIPFSLIGILPAHAALGAFFTATSMIGFIGGAGIVVRNSVILVDFIELRLADGMPLEQAVVEAGALRFRPMALTAAAVVVGAGVLLFDPIFQGLAISLMAGEIASLFLSRVTVPVLYYMTHRHRNDRALPGGAL
jgi:multidrug efflux pump subunit AcrB